MPTPRDDKLLRMDGWPGGVNNRIRGTEDVSRRDSEAIPNSAFLRKALNVDITAEGHPLRRRGYTQAEAGYAHSVFYADLINQFFVVIDGSLKVGPQTSELTTIMSVNRYLRMSYAHHAGYVYFMNGQESGRYSYAGLEVWPGPQQTHVVHDDEGLALVDNLYETMPIGQLVASFSGRIYVAKENDIWFSEGMSTHISRLAVNYYMLPKYIHMMQPVEDGIYVGSESNIIYLKGTDPATAEQVNVYPHGVVPYAFARIPGEKFGVPERDVPVWWTKDGVLSVGLPGGEVRQLTRDRLAAPEYGFGAVSIREREGISQVVSSLQKGGDANNMGASDTVTAEIRTC
jgi:hypothetical protein